MAREVGEVQREAVFATRSLDLTGDVLHDTITRGADDPGGCSSVRREVLGLDRRDAEPVFPEGQVVGDDFARAGRIL